MIRFRNVALAAGIIAVLSAGSAVNAGVIYDNLSVGMSAVDYAAMDGPLYNSFSAGASQSELTDVKMLLGGNPNSSASFTVNLLSDSAKSPGSVLTTLGTVSDGSLTSGAQSVDFTLAVPFILAADTRYWIELSGPTSSVGWSYGSSNGGTGTGGEYWAYNPSGVLTVSQNSSVNTPYQMQVTTAAVPEPGTFALGAIGIAVLTLARRRLARP